MKKTIMVVDDEPSVLNLVEGILEQEGYNVVKAQSGKDAFKKLKKVKPDLILLDFFMPEMTGREVFKRIRENKKLENLKVVFLTVATFSQAGVKELAKMNVLDYIKKPFKYKDLVKRIKKVIG